MSQPGPPLSLLLSRWQELHEQGHDATAAELCPEHPEWAQELAGLIALVRQLRTQAPDPLADDATSRLATVRPGQTAHPASHTAAPPQADGLPFVPGYAVQGILGRGGMGVVYRALDVALNRVVALKMMRGGPVAAEEVARFLAEAEAVAQLQHPGIVQVFGRGEHGGQPYFALELCDRGNLADHLGGMPMPPRGAATLTTQLADAVHYAHTRGIVHRDLKPANVLLRHPGESSSAARPDPAAAPAAPEPTLIAKVADFGLAKWVERDSGLTNTVAVMGTPSYMAPEQAGGLSKQVGPPADVWSLGALLYECLTGRPPFRGETVHETMRLVETAEPVPPRQLQSRIPRDLEVVCLKCLRKAPTQRYGSAGELGDDLRRFLAGEPIQARPVGPVEWLWKYGRRHPIRATLAVVAALVLLVVPPTVWSYSQKLLAAQAIADERDQAARKAELAALTDRYFYLLDRARERQSSRGPGWTWKALAEVDEAAGLPIEAGDRTALRSLIAEALGAVDLRPHAEVAAGTLSHAVAFSPDGRLLAVARMLALGHLSCRIHLIDLATRKSVRVLNFPVVPLIQGRALQPDGINRIAYSPDGRWLAAGTRGGQVVRFDLREAAAAPLAWTAHAGAVEDLTFSPDGTSLYSTGKDDAVHRWRTDRLGPARASFTGAGAIRRLAVHPRAGHLVVAGERGPVILEGLTLRELVDAPIRPRPGHPDNALAFSTDGATLLVGAGRQLHLVDFDARLVSHSFHDPDLEREAHSGSILAAAFSPDGSVVASIANGEGRVKLWEVASGRVAAGFFVGHGHALAFSPDGRLLAVAGPDRTFLLEVRPRGLQRFALVGPRPIESMAPFVLDGTPAVLGLGVQPRPHLEAVASGGPSRPEVRTWPEVWRCLRVAAALAEGRPAAEGRQAAPPAFATLEADAARLLDGIERNLPRVTDRLTLEAILTQALSAARLGGGRLDVSVTAERDWLAERTAPQLRAAVGSEAIVPLRQQLRDGKRTWWLNPGLELRPRRPDALSPGPAETVSAWLTAEGRARPGSRLLWAGDGRQRAADYTLVTRPGGAVFTASPDEVLHMGGSTPPRVTRLGIPRPRHVTLDPTGTMLWSVDQESGLLRSLPLHAAPGAGSTWVNPDPLFKRETGLHSLVGGKRWLLAGGQDGGLRLLPADEPLRLDRVFGLDRLPLTALALATDESEAAVGTQSGRVFLVRLPGGEARELPRLPGEVRSLAFDAGATLLATGSQDHAVHLWQRRADAWSRLLTLGFPSPVRQVSFSADRTRLLILLRGERAVRVWNLGRLQAELDRRGLTD